MNTLFLQLRSASVADTFVQASGGMSTTADVLVQFNLPPMLLFSNEMNRAFAFPAEANFQLPILEG